MVVHKKTPSQFCKTYPCMEYLPTFGLNVWYINVGKYTIHGVLWVENHEEHRTTCARFPSKQKFSTDPWGSAR